ncbi:MAG: 23S rRNA (guanosine(2251)-2'-O)-methyltransferase RlmB [Treponema sp.]|jgi:23S rRNA (guanosine2251-2'-O)-methyltransferase|nr:23S rRNA (guanosine(2251)-2'-O)-methyltransferase RlmB [Treponema sp.]
MIYLSGFHAIEEQLRSGKGCAALLVGKPGPRAKELEALAVKRRVPVNRVGTAELDRLAPGHKGIVLEAEGEAGSPDTSVEAYLADLGKTPDALVIILDEVTDPYNYGAILRSCGQFGADLVITRKRRIAGHAEAIARASAGASAWVPRAESSNLQRSIAALKDAGFWIYGAAMEGGVVWERDLRGRIALVLGGEGSGLSRLLRECCDALVSIPTLGKLDSLNVSVAAGVLMYEALRQRKKQPRS